jgi:hypothetical protein
MSKSRSRQSSRKTSGLSQNGASRTTGKTNAEASTTVSEEKASVTKPQPAAATKTLVSTQTPGKARSKDAARYERRQAERQMRYLAQQRARRTRVLAWSIGILLVIVIGGSVSFWIYQTRQAANASSAKTAAAPFQESVFDSNYPPVDNVYCDQLEQSVEHIHVYVTMYINGQAQSIPPNVGIAQGQQGGNATCFYWLHTHDSSGVIHIEAPATEPFTLGQFLDEWNQQFQSLGFPSQLLLTTGWKVWVNGKVSTHPFTSVSLDAHTIITIAYNSPNAKPATSYAWNGL